MKNLDPCGVLLAGAGIEPSTHQRAERRDSGADARGGDDGASRCDGIDDRQRHAAFREYGAQKIRITGAAPSEAEVEAAYHGMRREGGL